MNENMNRQEAELNEVALENVSGGSNLTRGSARANAQSICSNCHLLLHSKVNRSQHIDMLTNYLIEHGLEGSLSPRECPYFEQ